MFASKTNRKKIFVICILTTLMFIALLTHVSSVDECKTIHLASSVLNNNLLSSEQLNTILQYGLAIKTNPVMVTLVNDGYLRIALNWLCHTSNLAIHKQILVITTDQSVKLQLRMASMDINVFVLNKNIVKGDQEHGHVGYIRLLLWRTQILNKFIHSGVHTLLFEFDSIWFKNPIPYMLSFINSTDILCVKNFKNPGTVNGGFVYLFPTKSTKLVMEKMLNMLNNLYTKYSYLNFNCKMPSNDNDQEMLSRLISQRYSDIKVKMLPYSTFADGGWYELQNDGRNQRNPPYVLHNDYIVGNKAKIQRFKLFGHWFLDEDEMKSCNHSKVRFFIHQEATRDNKFALNTYFGK